MKRQLVLIGGCILLIGGWLSAFLMRALPFRSDFYFLLPALLLGIGIGLVRTRLAPMRVAMTVALTAVVSIASVNQFYPAGKISVFNFLQRLEAKVQEGQLVRLEVRDADKRGVFSVDRTLHALADIRVQLFTRLPGAPRMMTFDDAGNLYVSIPNLGAIYRLTDSNGDGFADQPVLYQAGLDRPHGLAWKAGKLYVAETSRLLELSSAGDAANQENKIRVILDNLPDDGGHWTRSLAIGGDGLLYLSVGSRCNVCVEADARRATVLQVDPQTGHSRVFARGLRNTVGLAFAPDGKTLWGSDNGRDMLGDDIPPDEINQLVDNGDYGWPFCYGEKIPDPGFTDTGRCEQTIPPAVSLQAHSAPLGLVFGEALKAPETFRSSLYVALHGSWNRSVPTGYKLIRIPFMNGRPGAGREFLFGWLEGGKAWGRPVDPVVGPDGSLYLSDDRADAIYKISWVQQE